MSLFGQTIENALKREMDDQKVHYKPESLDALVEKTHFSRYELKYLYQCFKQNCPSGYVTREQFIQIFRSFFSIHRYSDASLYAELVFNTFDDDRNNRISFSEFVIQLSLFTKGTLAQRLDWLFDLYDCNGRGYLTEDDHLTVCRAMYALVGVHYYKEKHIPVVVRRHIKHQFTKLDRNRDGKITREEFIRSCLDDNKIISSMEALKTVDAINSSIKMSLLNETVAHGWIRGRKETRDTYGGERESCCNAFATSRGKEKLDVITAWDLKISRIEEKEGSISSDEEVKCARWPWGIPTHPMFWKPTEGEITVLLRPRASIPCFAVC
ncbi:hypothetical protein Y032_0083g1627 [Ancylostoma ceylanicum]|nr:hypothetical protein Y032_0083g1627 [Ancylostoma ceylanicum]